MNFSIDALHYSINFTDLEHMRLEKKRNKRNKSQGGHTVVQMKFPVLSLSFPCVTKNFPVLFLRRN